MRSVGCVVGLCMLIDYLILLIKKVPSVHVLQYLDFNLTNQ